MTEHHKGSTKHSRPSDLLGQFVVYSGYAKELVASRHRKTLGLVINANDEYHSAQVLWNTAEISSYINIVHLTLVNLK